jgi:hypothetical protein
MAGMRAFALHKSGASAYSPMLSTKRSLFSQMAIVALTTVPLWKVIAGPAPAKTATGPARVRFSFSVVAPHFVPDAISCRRASSLLPEFRY